MSEQKEDDSNNSRESEDSESSSEDSSLNAELIKTKFSHLASALQETNQNLVTFEYLLDHYRSSSISSAKEATTPTVTTPTTPKELTSITSKPDCEVPNNIDIVDLLKDICGSVNDLKTEMGQNNLKEVSKLDLKHIENKIQFPQKVVELSGKYIDIWD